MMLMRFFLMIAAFVIWRDANNRRHPSWVEHATRWVMFAMLVEMLYLLLLLPVCLLLYVIHHGNADRAADVIHLGIVLRTVILSGMALMIATGTQLAGFARTVMKQFDELKWTSLLIATMATGLFLYIGSIATTATTMLDIRQGDNGMLAAFMVAWTLAIGRVCAVLFDRGRDSWDLGLPAFTRR